MVAEEPAALRQALDDMPDVVSTQGRLVLRKDAEPPGPEHAALVQQARLRARTRWSVVVGLGKASPTGQRARGSLLPTEAA